MKAIYINGLLADVVLAIVIKVVVVVVITIVVAIIIDALVVTAAVIIVAVVVLWSADKRFCFISAKKTSLWSPKRSQSNQSHMGRTLSHSFPIRA